MNSTTSSTVTLGLTVPASLASSKNGRAPLDQEVEHRKRCAAKLVGAASFGHEHLLGAHHQLGPRLFSNPGAAGFSRHRLRVHWGRHNNEKRRLTLEDVERRFRISAVFGSY
jgi:hypothetical protein